MKLQECELVRKWKEAVIAYFEILFCHLPGETTKTIKNLSMSSNATEI
jgi:hypothetical protein